MKANRSLSGLFLALAAAIPSPAASEEGPRAAVPGVASARPGNRLPAAGGPDVRPGLPMAFALPSDLPPAVPPADAPGLSPRAETRRETFTLRQLGALGPLALRGTSELQGVQFGIRSDEVVTGASLDLSGAMSPALLPEFSNVTITLNEQYVGTIPVNKDQPRFEHLRIEVSPVFFQSDNRLNFHFSGRYTPRCNDVMSTLLWSTIADTSTLTLTLVRLPPQRDLARLPSPFFDAHEKRPLVLPFAMAGQAGSETLQAAGIVSSWFGQLADFRGASFPVAGEGPRKGNGVVLATSDAMPAGLALPPIAGPTLALVPNPDDPAGSYLVVAGRTGAELIAAARTLVLGSRALGGDVAVVSPPAIADRKPYDAPAWLPTDRPVKFGELVSAADLQGVGYVPGALHVPFRTAPDLRTLRGRAFPVDLVYRAPAGPSIDLEASRLDMALNDLYLGSASLAGAAGDGGAAWTGLPDDPGAHRRLSVPPYAVFGRNDLRFSFDARPLDRGECAAMPNDLRTAVSPDSTIDLSPALHIATLPNLQFFVNSGFPFSRMADLSDSAVVLPRRPDPAETQAYLDLMGRIGSLTGTPALRVDVAFPEDVARVAGKDLLLIGTLDHLGAAAALLDGSGLRLDHGALEIGFGPALAGVGRLFGDRTESERRDAQAWLRAASTGGMAALVGARNPLAGDRSLVALTGERPEALGDLVASLRDGQQAAAVQGDLALRSGGRTTSYRVGPTYRVGSVPFWLYPTWLLQDSPMGVFALAAAAAALLAFAGFRRLRRRIGIRAG